MGFGVERLRKGKRGVRMELKKGSIVKVLKVGDSHWDFVVGKLATITVGTDIFGYSHIVLVDGEELYINLPGESRQDYIAVPISLFNHKIGAFYN